MFCDPHNSSCLLSSMCHLANPAVSWINLVESAVWSLYNPGAQLKLLKDFHWKLNHLCKTYDSWYCWYDNIDKIWEHLSKLIQMQIPNAISLSSDEQQEHTHHLHVLPPKLNVWISAFVHFHKPCHMFTNVSIVKIVTSSSFSVVVSK